MPPLRRSHRLPTLLFGCILALLTTPLAAQVQIDYTNGQTDATSYDTTAPNNPTTLSILSGTATQSGVLSGSGIVIKVGAGTLILSGLNTYTGSTTLRAGTLQVVAGGSMSSFSSNIFVAERSGEIARLLISGGTVGADYGGTTISIGGQAGSSGTVDMTGGTWIYGSNILVGTNGTGVLNISGGSSSASDGGIGSIYIGFNAGSSGTANVSGGTLQAQYLGVGNRDTGVLNISGGSVSNSNSILGYLPGSSGTVNMSGGIWNTNTTLVGYESTGVLNLTDSGIINDGNGSPGSGGSGTMTLAQMAGGTGTLNLGTGGAAGTLNVASIIGGDGTAKVNFNHTGSLNFTPILTGNMTVSQSGPGTTTLTQANTYFGDTFVFGGTLELGFGTVSANILATNTTLYVGNGTLLLSGEGTQTVFKFYAIGSGSIVLGQNQTLDLGTLGAITPGAAINFNTTAGGANGATVGSGVILLSGQFAGSPIHQGYTVTDTTGFGLATVNGLNQIVRLTTDLLPASGGTYNDYRIDNNAGGSTAAGSSSLLVTSSQSVISVTVDTTAAPGVLTLAPGAVLTSLIWNFGSIDGGGHAYEITGGASGAGLMAGVLINNYNSAPVTISAPILNSGVNGGIQLAGPGTTILTAVNTYIGSTIVTNGVLEVAAGGSISTTDTSSTIVEGNGSLATLLITGGSVSDTSSNIGQLAGSTGIATVSSGSWTSSGSRTIGGSGTGVLNISDTGSVSSNSLTLGSASGSSGTLNMSDGNWNTDATMIIGNNGTGVVNLSGGTVTSYTFFLGNNSGGSGTVNMSGGRWYGFGSILVGMGGTGVVNISDGTLSSTSAVLGSSSGSSGTLNMSGGNWYNDSVFMVGYDGTGILNLSGGTLSNYDGIVGNNTGTGTANVSGGNWTTNGTLYVGYNSTGVLNLTDSGTVTVGPEGSGMLVLASFVGSSGTLNLGTGGAAGTLEAASIYGVDGTAVVNFNHTGSYSLTPTLDGMLSVNQIGPGTTQLNIANTYTGTTSVLAGTLELGFYRAAVNILPTTTDLILGSATLRLSGSGTQSVASLSLSANSMGRIFLGGAVQTLNLGTLNSVGSHSALNFDTWAGRADGDHVGAGVITLSSQTAGAVINSSFTVTDDGGFGLATVNASNQIIRLTTTDLLPASGALVGKDYRINNNAGSSSTAGSATLVVSTSESARSITVDTTTFSGILTLAPGAVLSSDIWNFGGTRGSNTYAITTDSATSGLSAATAGGVLQINNYNSGTVSINAPILDNSGSGLTVGGTGTTLLNGSASYTGETMISTGTVFINGDFTAATGNVTVQNTATFGGTGTLGGNLHVQSGGILQPGNFVGVGVLSGITATFDSGSVFSLQGGGLITSLNLSGAATIASGATLSLNVLSDLTGNSYTLISAASGLDSAHAFTLSTPLPTGYKLVYNGTTLKLQTIDPVIAYWTGKVDNNWSSFNAGVSNWSTAVDGVTDTASLPASVTDVTFSATGASRTQTNLDVDFTINSLTVNSDTGISTTGTQTLTVNDTTTVNALLAINSGVTLIGNGALTVSTSGNLAGSGSVQMALNQSIFVNGTLSVGDPTVSSAQVLTLTTSGTGAVVMGPSSLLIVNLYGGAGLGDNTASLTAADQLSLHGTLNATAGGTLVINNPNAITGFAGGDHWKVIDLNSGAGTITGALALNDSGVGLTTGFVGTFDQTTGIYSIADYRGEITAQTSGLPMANAESQAIISGTQTALNDINNHLFGLRAGGGEEDDGSSGSIASAMDDGVIVGQGDGPEDKNPIAKRIKRSRQWEVFTTVNYGNARLNPISNQAGVQVDSWASSVGVERHLSRSVIFGFAATFLQSTQTYTGGLGKVDLEGPMLSAYLSYVHKSFWSSLLYSFGDFDLGSQRNPGLGLPSASGGTRAYTNAVQYNTGWNFRFQNNTLVTGPFIGIDYLHGSVESYSETGGGVGALAYAKQSFESLVTRVGWSTSKKFETNWATITPQLRLSYERQNLKNNGTSVSLINAPFSAAGGNQSPGQDYMVIGTGVNFQFTPDFSMLLGYQVQLFRNNMETHFGSVRFGYKF